MIESLIFLIACIIGGSSQSFSSFAIWESERKAAVIIITSLLLVIE